ncbi:alkaline phosphatase family protein [candidate division WOR-3 bacterium]|nr:alkaline phosphatase family protein [candidate division WOR-3 bacterium]
MKQHTRPIRTAAPLLVAALLVVALAFGSQTRNIFIVNIDGLRSTEGFEAEDLNLPFIWDSLRPLGTLYNNFQNTGVTVTNSAHSTIVTGVRQLMINGCSVWAPIRPREPTIGECYRKFLGAPADEAVFVVGKPLVWTHPISTYPGYGNSWAPEVVYTWPTDDDLATWDSTRAVIERSHPSLCYVLFGQVDAAGHSGDTSHYISSIHQADSLTFELWKLLRDDPQYRDSTTLIITSDHGRHDERHGGWFSHGCPCHGCRHVLFLAIGPDIKADTIVDDRADQIDIAPTVAGLLGFPMPFAQGRVLSAMLRPGVLNSGRTGPSQPSLPTDGHDISNSAGLSRSCDLAADATAIHCVFSDNTDVLPVIHYTRSTDHGSTWSAPGLLLYSDGDAIEYSDPAIATFGDSGLFVVATCCRYVPDETTYIWTLYSRRSTNSGETWGPETEIESLGMVTSRPAIAARGQRIEVVCLRDSALTVITSRDGGQTFGAPERLPNWAPHYAQFPTLALSDTFPRVAWQDLVPCKYWNPTSNHNIWIGRRPWYLYCKMVTHNTSASLSAQPSIECDALDPTGDIHLVCSDLRDAQTGNWTATYMHGWARGDSWSEPVTLSGDHVGFAPCVKASGNGRLFCVWTELENDEWFIAGSSSDDSGRTWSDPVRITSDGQLVAEPRLVASGDTCLVVWQSRDSDNWEIYFGSHAFPPLGVSERPVPPAPRLALSAVPNPCHGSTLVRWTTGPLDHSSTLRIFDASGRLVSSLNVHGSSSRVPVPAAAGVYVLRLDAGGRLATARLVVD